MRTKYINRLIGRITASSQSNNDSFDFYGHHIDLQSGTTDYVSATIYRTADPYSGETVALASPKSLLLGHLQVSLNRSRSIAIFSFDFWTKELCIEYAESEEISKAIATAFRNIYGHIAVVD